MFAWHDPIILGTSPTKAKTTNKTQHSLFSCYGGALIGKFADGGRSTVLANKIYRIVRVKYIRRSKKKTVQKNWLYLDSWRITVIQFELLTSIFFSLKLHTYVKNNRHLISRKKICFFLWTWRIVWLTSIFFPGDWKLNEGYFYRNFHEKIMLVNSNSNWIHVFKWRLPFNALLSQENDNWITVIFHMF